MSKTNQRNGLKASPVEAGWIVSGGARDSYPVHRDVQGSHVAGCSSLRRIQAEITERGCHIDAVEYRGSAFASRQTSRRRGATQRVDFWARAQASDSPATVLVERCRQGDAEPVRLPHTTTAPYFNSLPALERISSSTTLGRKPQEPYPVRSGLAVRSTV